MPQEPHAVCKDSLKNSSTVILWRDGYDDNNIFGRSWTRLMNSNWALQPMNNILRLINWSWLNQIGRNYVQVALKQVLWWVRDPLISFWSVMWICKYSLINQHPSLSLNHQKSTGIFPSAQLTHHEFSSILSQGIIYLFRRRKDSISSKDLGGLHLFHTLSKSILYGKH